MKLLKNYTNLDAVTDADGSVFFNRELERIIPNSFDVKYPALKARMLFPVSNEGGFGITSITYHTYDQRGTAKIINSYAKDAPRADIGGKETTIPVKELGIAYAYTVKEIASSQLTGKSLDQRRANAARRAIEEGINKIAWFGDEETGLPGLFSNPTIPRVTVVNGAGGQPEWINKTPDEILFDMNDLVTDIFENTNQIEQANTLLLPTAQWSLISSTPRSANSDTTILQYFVQNSQFITSAEDVIPVNELKGAGTGGVDVMIAYDRNPEKVQLEIPGELQFLAPQEKGFEIEIPGWSAVGGLNVYYPLSFNIGEGI